MPPTSRVADEPSSVAQPKRRRGQTAAAPLRELGDDPVSGAPVVLKNGRYGPYVTDGDVNASLRKGDSIEELTDERAAELLQMRREKAPTKKKAAPKKKASAKKKTSSATRKRKSSE